MTQLNVRASQTEAVISWLAEDNPSPCCRWERKSRVPSHGFSSLFLGWQ